MVKRISTPEVLLAPESVESIRHVTSSHNIILNNNILPSGEEHADRATGSSVNYGTNRL